MENVNAIRMLSNEMIEKANSGHPGICMGAAPMMYQLYAKELKIYAQKSNWVNRDRFVLSAGHGSAMLYSTLHLSGYDISINDLKEFRQLGSRTPGHPEVGHTDGIDSTSGPLGQGISQAVGLALAENHLSAKYNREGYEIIDHYTYTLCGDGDLQEGVASEAASLAGHLKLNKLIVLWDSNDIQLDAPTKIASTENILMRFESYGWETQKVNDGNNLEELAKAIEIAKKSDKPTLIEVKTVIGYGSPNKSGKPDAHGAPLGKDELKLVKDYLNWSHDEFTVSKEIYESFQNNTITTGQIKFSEWEKTWNEYQKVFPELANELKQKDTNLELLEFAKGVEEATRVSSGKAINNIAEQVPNFIGGSADLSKSNNTTINSSGVYSSENPTGKNISYGVREFAMASITNGIMIHGGLKAFCSTFFVFSDYLKPAIRMSAIQNIGSVFVMTHDSIAVGEDGPTHEPIEQLSGLRAIPNIQVIRPADANETQVAWDVAMKTNDKPTVLVLTRQNLAVVTTLNEAAGLRKGAYVISDQNDFEQVLIASGSEVNLALNIQVDLREKGVRTRVVSMPSIELFLKQSQEYQDSILGSPSKANRHFIEMANSPETYRFADNVYNITTFGASGNGQEIINEFGFTSANICKLILGENK